MHETLLDSEGWLRSARIGDAPLNNALRNAYLAVLQE